MIGADGTTGDCVGPTVLYQFRIEPADAVVTKACYDATVAERRAIRNVTIARRAVTRASLRRNEAAVRSAC